MEKIAFADAKILIIDDQIANIELLTDLIELEGYRNHRSVTNSFEAVDCFKTFMPDIVLLDLMMPGLNGFQIMSRIKESLPANTFLPILVLTADITPESRKKALAEGASDFISKPFDLVEVSLRIKNLLYARKLHNELGNQNHLLEEKVKQRTAQLETMNDELMIAIKKAEASDRMKSSFINNITHEIRTPLTSIVGFSQMLAGSDVSGEDKKELFEIISDSSNRLINTVTDYLDISMLVSGNQQIQMSRFNFFTLIDKQFSTFEKQASAKGVHMVIGDQCDRELEIHSDALLLSKVVKALIDNAVKFTSAGEIEIGFYTDELELTFYVKDTGVGVDRVVKDEIFDAFTQESIATTRGYEGSGLGLTISKHIVNLLGGKISYESAKNCGSTFSVVIPMEQ